MTGFLRKLWLLSWKNLKFVYRHPIKFAFELAMPILMFGIIAYVQSILVNNSVETVNTPTLYKIHSAKDIIETFPSTTVKLYYVPKNNFTTRLMKEVREMLRFNNNRLEYLSSEAELEAIYAKNRANSTTSAIQVMAVIFEGSLDLPKNLVYKIRTGSSEWKTSLLFPKREAAGPVDNSEIYFHSGFLALQYAIETSFTNLIKPRKSIPVEFNVQGFPYPPYTPDVGSQQVSAEFLAIGVVFGIVPLLVNVLGSIMGDKSSGATELMKLMGLSRLLLWTSWFVRAMAVSIVLITVITCLLMIPMNAHSNPPFAESDVSLVWIMFVLYFAAVAVFIFFISTLFSRAIFASIFSQIIWVVSYSVGQNLIKSSSALSIKLLSSFLPNMAIYWGLSIIESFEARHIGARWSNLCKLPEGGTFGMCLAHVLLMLIVDIALFSFLTWYLDTVMPGTYGVPQSWDFCFSKAYWRSSRVDSSQTFNSLANLKNYEPAPQSLEVGIRIQDLRKIYASGKVAVDGVTLDIYEDQITALLGHNGAGKTTTMSILTGMLASSSGNIWINNYNIRTDLAKVRESLGLCPQHDMLFPELNVMEHLVFFAMLKGCAKADAQIDAASLLEHLSLEEKANVMGSKLSGGMKRKLSLGIALVGGSRVVMLDEPTSGLDPEARRKVWDLLLSMRGQRTILLTTHFMEEADVLGDRIAIMDHGRVQCYGSSLYLKKLYGAGYILKLLTRDDHDEQAIAKFVQRSLPGAKVKSRLGTEVAFALPLEQKPLFPGLFHEIESNKTALGIVSMGVSLTTLEDVFLNVGRLAKEADDEADGKCSQDDQTDSEELLRKGIYKRLQGLSFRIQQLEGLLIKKFIYLSRHWGLLLVLASIALLTMAGTIALSFNVLGSQRTSEPPLTLSLNRYGGTEVLHTATRSVAVWYEALVAAQGSVSRSVSQDEGLLAAILAVATKDMAHYREGLMVAADIRTNSSLIFVNAMYSGISYHSAAISVNLLNNALLRGVMNSDQYSITVTNHPFKQRGDMEDAITQALVVSALWQIMLPFGLCFLLGYFLIFPLTERLNNGKQLQLMSGIRPLGYWAVCYFCDALIYILATLAMVIMLYVWDVNGAFGGSTEAGVLTLILVLHGLSGIPYAYFFSYFNKTPLSGFSIFFTINCMMVTLLPVVISIFEVFSHQGSNVSTIKKLLCVSPPYALVQCLMEFVSRVVQNNRCPSISESARKQLCLDSPADPCCGVSQEPRAAYLALESVSDPAAIGWPLIIMAIDAVLYLSIILLMDHGVIARVVEAVKRLWLSRTRVEEDEVDADVRLEMDRVNESDCDVLTVTALSKVFGRSHRAVRGLSFGVPPGDCFGLLGVNGAGKTTTFRMLTGDLQPTAGDASIDGCHLATNRDQFLSRIGYCPQFDGFNESLTGREVLELYARLRGIPMEEIGNEVRRWLVVMGLGEYQDCVSGTYSGGNKRKLSTAMALIGEPALVFLDEPTSGVDPVARRNLWKVLAAVQTTDTAIVLTSHSMEECEALCNRLAIMVDGQFKCIGETQYLKQKFGQGFTVLIKLKTNEPDPSAVDTFKGAFRAMFAKSVLKDEHQGWLHYHLTDPNTRWKDLFSNMEELKMRYATVEDYTVSETTLEQVFLSFAKRSNLT